MTTNQLIRSPDQLFSETGVRYDRAFRDLLEEEQALLSEREREIDYYDLEVIQACEIRGGLVDVLSSFDRNALVPEKLEPIQHVPYTSDWSETNDRVRLWSVARANLWVSQKKNSGLLVDLRLTVEDDRRTRLEDRQSICLALTKDGHGNILVHALNYAGFLDNPGGYTQPVEPLDEKTYLAAFRAFYESSLPLVESVRNYSLCRRESPAFGCTLGEYMAHDTDTEPTPSGEHPLVSL